ncbi:MAG: DNA polymerase III subunit gamma/tau [Rudaea sp.]
MSYQVLARKWRPRRFSELVGQEHVVRALSNALDSDRMHHAFLFTGTRGVGKTTIARIFAKSLNCERGQSSNPCGECSSCKDIDAGRFMDMIEIDAASNTGVDDVREVIENAQYTPSRGRFKVYLIDEVHMLSKSAFNALLKTLEEPPEHVKFLLATTDPQKLPVTVLSRCLKFNLKRLLPDQISGQMQRILDAETIVYEIDALQELSRGADGSLRDGLSLLDQAIAYGAGAVRASEVRAMLGTIERGRVFALLDAVRANDGAKLMDEIDRLAEFSPDFAGVLDDVAGALHRIQLKQLVATHVLDDRSDESAVAELATAIPPEEIQLLYQIAVNGRRDISLAPNPRAGFDMTMLRMLAFRPADGSAKSANPSSRPAPAPVAPQAPRFAETKPVPAAKPTAPPVVEKVVETKTEAVAPQPFNGDWADLIKRAGIGGPTGEVARNSALIGIDNGVVQLSLKDGHHDLITPSLIGAMQDKLGAALGYSVKVKFEKSAIVVDTPAEVSVRESAARQRAAEQAMGSDMFVQALIRDFDARVIPESIKPAAPTKSAEK